jgi:hypothetical protein
MPEKGMDVARNSAKTEYEDTIFHIASSVFTLSGSKGPADGRTVFRGRYVSSADTDRATSATVHSL